MCTMLCWFFGSLVLQCAFAAVQQVALRSHCVIYFASYIMVEGVEAITVAEPTLEQFLSSVPWEGIDENLVGEVLAVFQENKITVSCCDDISQGAQYICLCGRSLTISAASHAAT